MEQGYLCQTDVQRRLVLVSSSWVAGSLSAVLCREEAVFEQGERQMERLLTLQELAEDEVSQAASCRILGSF